MVDRASGPGKEKAAYKKRYPCDDTRMGIPVLRLIVAIGPVECVQDQNASRSSDHTIRKDSVAEIIMCPPDCKDLLIMKGEAIKVNAIVPQFGNGTLHPLMINGLHGEI